MSDKPIRVEVQRYHVRQPDERFETFKDAAIVAAYACDLNTAWYGEAVNDETREKRSRGVQLDAGFAAMEQGEDKT
jgi:hypothetical protein